MQTSEDAKIALEESKRRGCDTCLMVKVCRYYPVVVDMEKTFKDAGVEPAFEAVNFAKICNAYVPVMGGA